MDSFLNSIQDATHKLSQINSPIRVISHLDSDGLTSASIFIKTLANLDKSFSLSIVRQLSPKILIVL